MFVPSVSSARDVGSPRARRYALAALAIALGLAVWGILSRVSARATLATDTATLAIPAVSTIKPAQGQAAEALVLPGSVQAYNEALIHARTNGYLLNWYTDIGTRVKKGQLLADIDTPEVDEQLRQARADLATAQANFDLALSTNQRWQGLLSTKSVSQQAADAAAGDSAAKKATLASAAANVARLSDLESFKRVLAPFDGVVTSRTTDIGALINAGQGTALFSVADVRRLRVYVQVPQLYASSTTPGLDADLTFAERPGKTYPARVVSTADALDPNSRTLQVELLVDNAAGELFPGAYSEVHFKLPSGPDSLRLPANAVLFRSTDLQVAVVGKDHRVTLKNITTGRDFGTSMEVLSGLSPGDDVVVNPPDSITTGALVRLAPPPAPAQSPQSAPSSAPTGGRHS
ncbi:MAG: efflux transporter periplasmic adaptor subunit [Gammaproteobacteria bacterium]|jgi:multidrug efflux system membrane fusion protein|nr:efflux transporter periplasmic adaptor subunit [Gammaproteobacteria bacterium]